MTDMSGTCSPQQTVGTALHSAVAGGSEIFQKGLKEKKSLRELKTETIAYTKQRFKEVMETSGLSVSEEYEVEMSTQMIETISTPYKETISMPEGEEGEPIIDESHLPLVESERTFQVEIDGISVKEAPIYLFIYFS